MRLPTSVRRAAELAQLVRFSGASLLVVGVNFATYAILTYLGVAVEIASVIGSLLGLLVGYRLHAGFTFRTRGRGQVLRYFATYGVQIAASVSLLSLLTRKAHLHPVVAYLVGAVVVTVGTYLALRLWVFRQSQEQGA